MPYTATIECGLANQYETANNRIVSGSQVSPNEFPWLAHLTIYFWSGDSATCGGTVIGDRWILTAAHCTYGAVNVTVTLGAHDITDSNEVYQQKFLGKSVTTHPFWRYGDVENDVALIELPQAAILSGNYWPIFNCPRIPLFIISYYVWFRLCPAGLFALFGRPGPSGRPSDAHRLGQLLVHS